MKKQISLITIIFILMTMGYASFAFGAVSAEDASKLGGSELTPIGAERAGNKEGTIPAWSGVPIPIPKGFKPGSGFYVDPFADEKPLFSISQKNMAQYADKLAEGVKILMKRYPDYRIDVYKTHRTIVFPQWRYDNTKKNATACITTNNGLTLSGKGCHGGTPFPIVKEGIEAFWNHMTRYFAAESASYNTENYNISSAGKVSVASQSLFTSDSVWNDPNREDDLKNINWRCKFTGPPRRNGEYVLLMFPRDYAKTGHVVWQYLPGQRRVRLAPDICCDTPSSSTGGASTYDDASVFNASPDRFNWKIIGKKEMYIPYNAYKFTFYQGPVDKALFPHFVNPDLVRWELHRVWVLEATLKPGKRHVYSKRLFFIDEDTWAMTAADNYDKRGDLYRMTISHPIYSYDVQSVYIEFLSHYDLISNSYAMYLWPRLSGGIQYMKYHPDSFFSPDALAGGGLR